MEGGLSYQDYFRWMAAKKYVDDFHVHVNDFWSRAIHERMTAANLNSGWLDVLTAHYASLPGGHLPEELAERLFIASHYLGVPFAFEYGVPYPVAEMLRYAEYGAGNPVFHMAYLNNYYGEGLLSHEAGLLFLLGNSDRLFASRHEVGF